MSEDTTLGDVLVGIETGKSFQTSEILAKPDELGVLKVSAVSWTDFLPGEAKALSGAYTPAESHKVKKGDLLISRANTRELVGAVVLVERDYPMRLLSDKTLRLVIDEQRASKAYLMYALRSSEARGHIEHFATGTSDSMRNISQDVIKAIPIWLPTLDEQRRIAARLKAQLAEVETARQAAQAQVLDAAFLQKRLLCAAFDALCEKPTVPIGKLAHVQLGKMLSPKAKTGKESFVYLRNQNVQWARFDLRDMASMDFDERERAKFALRRGDLLICEGGEPGRCAVWNEDIANCFYQKALHRLRPHADLADSEFLAYWLRFQANTGAFSDQNAKTTIAHLPLARLELLPVPDIAVSEQRLIVTRLKAQLTEADTIAQAAAAQLAEIEKLPQQLLARAFHTTPGGNP